MSASVPFLSLLPQPQEGMERKERNRGQAQEVSALCLESLPASRKDLFLCVIVICLFFPETRRFYAAQTGLELVY